MARGLAWKRFTSEESVFDQQVSNGLPDFEKFLVVAALGEIAGAQSETLVAIGL